MESIVEQLSSIWFLILTLVFLVAGWVRFEQVQKRSNEKDVEHETKLKALEEDFKKEVERLGKNSGQIGELRNDIEWIKKSLERMESNMNNFMITYPRSLIDNPHK